MLKSERENQAWEGLVRKYGVVELARRIAKRPPYRKYISRWPFDHTEQKLSLEVLYESGFEAPGGEEVEEAIASDELVEKFLATLTPKQQVIMHDLMKGYNPKDLFKGYEYKTTGGIRYHKWSIRKLWKAFIEEHGV